MKESRVKRRVLLVGQGEKERERESEKKSHQTEEGGTAESFLRNEQQLLLHDVEQQIRFDSSSVAALRTYIHISLARRCRTRGLHRTGYASKMRRQATFG